MMDGLKDCKVWRFNLKLLPPTLTKNRATKKEEEARKKLTNFPSQTILYYVIRREQMFPFAKLFLKKVGYIKNKKK